MYFEAQSKCSTQDLIGTNTRIHSMDLLVSVYRVRTQQQIKLTHIQKQINEVRKK